MFNNGKGIKGDAIKVPLRVALYKTSVVFDNGYTIKGPIKGPFTQTSVAFAN